MLKTHTYTLYTVRQSFGGGCEDSIILYAKYCSGTLKDMYVCFFPSKVLISKSTFEYLQGEYDVEPANVWSRSQYLRDRKTETYYVVPGARRRVRYQSSI